MDYEPTPTTLIWEAENRQDANEIAFGLRLRGISSVAEPGSGAIRILVCPEDADTAKAALQPIIEAMLPTRATDSRGRCIQCQYDLVGTPLSAEQCPECGQMLKAIKARFKARRLTEF